MILDYKVPELPKNGALIQIPVMHKRIFSDCKPNKENRVETPLCGHLIHIDYVSPENDAWMHPHKEDVDSEEPQDPQHHIHPQHQSPPHRSPPQSSL